MANLILGAISGDVIGSSYEFSPVCQYDFELFNSSSSFTDLESTDFESAIRLAISLGGDADTMGAIAGAV